MEGYFVRLLGLDQSESYARLYRSVRKTESQFRSLQASLSEGRRRLKDLELQLKQFDTAVEFVDRWLRIKEQISNLEKDSSAKSEDVEEKRKVLLQHETEIAENLKNIVDKPEDPIWSSKDPELIIALKLDIVKQQREVFRAHETCSDRFQTAELALSTVQTQQKDQDASVVKIVDEAYQRAHLTMHPDRILNATEQNQRVWNDIEQGYRILRNPVLHRKYVCADNQEAFYKELAKLQLGNVEEDSIRKVGLAQYTEQRRSLQACHMPMIIEESSELNSRIITVTMQWTCSFAEAGVTEYQLQRKSTKVKEFEVVYEGKATECVLDLLPDEYAFRVRGRNIQGTGPFSVELVYVAHDQRPKEKNAAIHAILRNQSLSEAYRQADQNLRKVYKTIAEGSVGTKVEELAEALNEARKNKVDLIGEDLVNECVNLLKRYWNFPEKKVQKSQWGLKLMQLIRETLTPKPQDSFLKLIRSDIWAKLSPEALNNSFNFLLLLAIRALRLNYPPMTVDATLRVIHAAIQTKNPSNAFWIRRLHNVFERLRRKLQVQQQQWSQPRKVQGEVKAVDNRWKLEEAKKRNREKQKEELQKQKVKDRRETERQAARLREQKRKALHEKLWRQQVAQGKVPPKAAKPPPAKPPLAAPVKPSSKFRSYPKHHQQGKFQLCKFWLVGQSCRKQPCWFAHGKEELADWYRQREEEQIRKKQNRKVTPDSTPPPTETFNKQRATTAVTKRPTAPVPAKLKEPRILRTKSTPAPVVKSVWQKNTVTPKRAEEAPVPLVQKLTEDNTAVKELSGFWQGKSTKRNNDVMLWQSCDLKFNLQQGKVTGTALCVWRGEKITFKIEGVIRYPEVTLKRQSTGNYANQETFNLRIERGAKTKMTGMSQQAWLVLTRGNDEISENRVEEAATKPLQRMAPSPKVSSTPSRILTPIDSFGSVGSVGSVGASLDSTAKTQTGNKFFSSFPSGRNSGTSSPVTLRPTKKNSFLSSNEISPDRKAEIPIRPLGGMGTIFSKYGGSSLWGSLNPSGSLNASAKPTTNADQDFKLNSGINSQQAKPTSTIARNGVTYPSFMLPRVSKSAPNPTSPFVFGSLGLKKDNTSTGTATASSTNSYGSLFSTMHAVNESKWNAPQTGGKSILLGNQINSFPPHDNGKKEPSNGKKTSFSPSLGGQPSPFSPGGSSPLWR
mmetsp:Transcript_192/g.301  ORF Transcript_192/g.301 Transcript_192/m.301 type:complete len:1183 (+) Transcript_192:70-3618(+)